MAHETAVHRVDAELAAGAPTPIDSGLATDGIAEILEIMLAGDWSDEPDEAASGQRVSIEAGDRSWLVTMDRAAIEVNEVDPRDENTQASIAGDPSDVDLWLWGRASDDRIRRSGDEPTLALLRSRLVFATQ
jgi:hypothetical protein